MVFTWKDGDFHGLLLLVSGRVKGSPSVLQFCRNELGSNLSPTKTISNQPKTPPPPQLPKTCSKVTLKKCARKTSLPSITRGVFQSYLYVRISVKGVPKNLLRLSRFSGAPFTHITNPRCLDHRLGLWIKHRA